MRKSFSQYFYEAFNDLGKLSPEQLTKGYRLDPSDDDNFKQVNGKIFHTVLKVIMRNDSTRGEKSKKLRENITIYDVTDYLKMRCFLGKNNSSGFCIKDGDELVSVFSSLDSSGHAAVKKAIEEGARRLDCFAEQDRNGNILNTGLYKLYSSHGFKIDRNKNEGNPNEPYSIQNGISYFVDAQGNVDPTNSTVVIFMKL